MWRAAALLCGTAFACTVEVDPEGGCLLSGGLVDLSGRGKRRATWVAIAAVFVALAWRLRKHPAGVALGMVGMGTAAVWMLLAHDTQSGGQLSSLDVVIYPGAFVFGALVGVLSLNKRLRFAVCAIAALLCCYGLFLTR